MSHTFTCWTTILCVLVAVRRSGRTDGNNLCHMKEVDTATHTILRENQMPGPNMIWKSHLMVVSVFNLILLISLISRPKPYFYKLFSATDTNITDDMLHSNLQIFLHKKGKFYFSKESQAPDNVVVNSGQFKTLNHIRLKGKNWVYFGFWFHVGSEILNDAVCRYNTKFMHTA